MKYLGIHKVIWAALVIFTLLLHLMVYFIFECFYFLWNFKFFPYGNLFGEYDYVWYPGKEHLMPRKIYDGDKNPIETFKRWYGYLL